MSGVYARMHSAANRSLFPNIYLYNNPYKIFEYRELVKHTRFSKTDRLLDLGCGAGIQACCLARRVRLVVGLDICDLSQAKQMARMLDDRHHVEFIRGRLQDSHLPDKSFDKIFSFCVIEHIPDYTDVLRACRDILVMDGEMILSVDSLATIPLDVKARHAKKHAVVKYFRPEELRQILHKTGFRHISVYPMLRSKHAARMFSRGIQNNFRYTPMQTVFEYVMLCLFESVCRSNEGGVFLAARCRK